MRRLDEQGHEALVQTPAPVNRFPAFVAQLVHRLRATLPALGKVRIAQLLARAGLHLAPTTVARFGRKPPPNPAGSGSSSETPEAAAPLRTVTARYPHHV